MRILPVIFFLSIVSCKLPEKPASKEEATATITVKDPHSFAKPEAAVVKHLDLDIKVDFEKQEIAGKAIWTIDNISKGNEIVLDAGTLNIQQVTLDNEEKQTAYHLDSAVTFLGKALHITIQPNTQKITIVYTTIPGATALQWLTPAQTAGKKFPYLFTQSEPILARTWIPCQDGPGVRFTYNATVTVPNELMAIMSAQNPQQKNDNGVYQFKQTHPIPSYLVALAVGDIAFKSVNARTGVYAEPAMVDKVAWEFADMGKMLDAAEKLYGSYQWGRYDVLVLPPSFPYGGMENPNLTFVTPALVAGDRSLVSVIAHELAHSWSGNLVTNATWNDMWLNEGFTTYFERRIIEVLYGKKEKEMQEVLGWQDLMVVMAEKGDTSMDTRLKVNYEGRDPDGAASNIAYEKGYAFLRAIENVAGRAKLDSFLRYYFGTYAFHSITTEQFLDDLEQKLLRNDTALIAAIRVKQWVYGPGLPVNTPAPVAQSFKALDELLQQWHADGYRSAVLTNKRTFSTNEALYFISHLPADISYNNMSTVDSVFQFTRSHNTEVQAAWYTICIRRAYTPANASIEKFLTSVGRRKYLLPIYKALVKTPAGKAWAGKIFAVAKNGYHPVAAQSVEALLKK